MVEHPGEILILTGPPGAGKTTTAEALAQLPGSPKVHLHSDDFWGFIKHGLIPPYLPEAHAQNAMVLEAAAGVCARYAQGGYFVVMDGIVGPWFLRPFQALGIPLHYVVLRPPLEEAIRRCEARGGNTLTDPVPIADLHRQFAALGEREQNVLLTNGQTRPEMLQAVLEALRSGRYRLPDESPL